MQKRRSGEKIEVKFFLNQTINGEENYKLIRFKCVPLKCLLMACGSSRMGPVRMLRYLEGQFAEKVMGMDSIQGTQTQACQHAAAHQQDQVSGSEL